MFVKHTLMPNFTSYFFFIFFLYGLNVSSQTFERQILSSTDDAEEKFDGSEVLTDSSDLELMYDGFNNQGLQTVGLRFDDIAIPSSATITNAYIQFTADGDNQGNIVISIQGEDVVNSASFVDQANNISNRATTAASITWDVIPTWDDDAAGMDQRTPDLSTIVSEIISSNGWQSSNPITFILTGTGNENDRRKAESFDGGATLAPKLVIEYTSNSNVDLALTSISLPTSTTYENGAALVQAEIRSFGILTATNYTISYSINGLVIATEQATVPLTVGQSTIFTFVQTADLSVLGTYDLSVEVSINNDENTANNLISKEVSVVEELESIFFSQESAWRYWDQPADPGASWNTIGFDDASWFVGAGQFGFGDADEETTLNDGLISYYFRKKVTVPDANALNDVYIKMIHDDGAMMFINGVEVLRSELIPLGTINHTTSAKQRINNSIENDYFTYKIAASFFVTGENTIAVTVRNTTAGDEDFSFDCFIIPNYTYDKDGPYVFYDGTDIIVEEVTPGGLISNTYTTPVGLTLTCDLPHMGTSFTFSLKPEITIEPSIDLETPSTFLAISDFDGHIAGLTQVLVGEGVMDEDFNWTYGEGHLMISGDLFDRGFHIQESMWLLYKLESEAEANGGKIHLIIGNHEMFNMTDDWRYVETKYFNDAHLMGKRMSELYDENTELGRWLRSKNIIERVGDYAFMHGGITPEVAALELTYEEINDYGRLRMNGIPCPNSDCIEVNSGEGIYWYRGMVEEALTQVQVDDIIDGFSVASLILGHTKDTNIRSLYEGRVIAIDMFHVSNFNNGFMKALQFELGCFFSFRTSASGETFTPLDADCEQTLGRAITLNGDAQLQLYPNPSSDFLNIKMPSNTVGNYNYTIVDMKGRKLDQGIINQEVSTIKVRNYACGRYILIIKNADTIIKGSFILK
tara:strand:- start:49364 stop:52132 length:2769 start_codon:yes stop_codon:yes gene_type:complete